MQYFRYDLSALPPLPPPAFFSHSFTPPLGLIRSLSFASLLAHRVLAPPPFPPLHLLTIPSLSLLKLLAAAAAAKIQLLAAAGGNIFSSWQHCSGPASTLLLQNAGHSFNGSALSGSIIGFRAR